MAGGSILIIRLPSDQEEKPLNAQSALDWFQKKTKIEYWHKLACCVAKRTVAQARRLASHVRGLVCSPPGSGLQPAGKRNGTQRTIAIRSGGKY